MNTLKPLLVVAVLAGIGYGVYVRVNSGNDAPPPTVAAGWDTTPKVQMPEDSSGGPWSNSPPPAPTSITPPFMGSRGSASPGSASPGGEAPRYVPPAGGEAPAYAPPAGGEAPSYAPPAGGDAPRYDGSPEAPPYQAANSAPSAEHAPPPADYAGSPSVEMTPPGAEQPPADAARDNPYTYLPPHEGADAPAAGGPPEGYRNEPPAEGNQTDPASRYRQEPPAGYPAGPADRYQSPPVHEVPMAGGSGDTSGLSAALEAAKRDLESGQLTAALKQLSAWHDHPQLSPAQQQELQQLLDQVAGTVIYSTQNLVEAPYEVQSGERLEDIGERFKVPWQLLAKINGIDDPQSLRPGERLKVVRGPFNAVVSLEKRQLTLQSADGMYAGRFAIGLGRENPPQEGTYTVSDKVVNPIYHGRDRAVSAEDLNNPLGERWIGLGGNIGIHGTNQPENIGRTDLPGSISLSPRDVEDVYDILSVGSRVTVRR